MCCDVPSACCHQVFDFVERLDAASGSDGCTVQGGRGAGEVELSFERPILKEAVDETGVEDIARSGGIDYRDTIGGCVVKLLAVPRYDAFFS
jgi:hypothetical protein